VIPHHLKYSNRESKQKFNFKFNFNIHPTPKEKTVVDNYDTIILMLNGATTVEIEISVKV